MARLPSALAGRSPARLVVVDDRAAELILAHFSDCTLPKPQWTHEAHVVVCWGVLQEMEPEHALTHLRQAIRRYNEATGVANTTTDGYHETITAYYVGAVASLLPCDVTDALAAARCRRSAPLDHWSPAALFTPTARAGWVDPDLVPLPWQRARQESDTSGPGPA